MARLHLWQIQSVRDIAVVLMVLGVVYLGYKMSLVTVPLLLALLLAYLLEPPIAWLARRTSRVFAAVAAIVLMALVLVVPVAGGIGLATVQGARFIGGLDKDLTKFVDQIERVLGYLERDSVRVIILDGKITDVKPGGDEPEESEKEGESEPQDDRLARRSELGGAPDGDTREQPEKPAEAAKPDVATAEPEVVETTLVQKYAGIARQWIRENTGSIAAGQVAQQAGSAFQIGWNVLYGVGMFVFKYLFLLPFFFFFWSVGFGNAQRFGAELIPEKKRAKTLDIIRKMDRAIAAFIRGRFTIALILSVCFTLAYWAIGVPAPLIFGPLVGILSIVPYLPLIGWPATILAMAIDQAGASDPHPWWWIILGPSIVYFVLQSLDEYVLTPKIQGKNVGLSTPVILFAVLGAGAIAGVYGVLIAIPIAACIKILITDVIFPRYKDWVEGRAKDPLPLGDDPQP